VRTQNCDAGLTILWGHNLFGIPSSQPTQLSFFFIQAFLAGFSFLVLFYWLSIVRMHLAFMRAPTLKNYEGAEMTFSRGGHWLGFENSGNVVKYLILLIIFGRFGFWEENQQSGIELKT